NRQHTACAAAKPASSMHWYMPRHLAAFTPCRAIAFFKELRHARHCAVSCSGNAMHAAGYGLVARIDGRVRSSVSLGTKAAKSWRPDGSTDFTKEYCVLMCE